MKSLDEFFHKLDSYYDKIKGTNCSCKYYAQATTFSFEIHDRRETCYTPKSLKVKSKVYDFWVYDKDVRKEILKDIRREAKKIK